MKVELNFPDDVFQADKDFVRFFEALQLMLNRMAVSHHKYGTMGDNNHREIGQVDAVKTARQRMTMYDGLNREDSCTCGFGRENLWMTQHDPSCFLLQKRLNTGNTENLLDSANCLIIGHLFPLHPKAHFRAQRAEDSPGLARTE